MTSHQKAMTTCGNYRLDGGQSCDAAAESVHSPVPRGLLVHRTEVPDAWKGVGAEEPLLPLYAVGAAVLSM